MKSPQTMKMCLEIMRVQQCIWVFVFTYFDMIMGKCCKVLLCLLSFLSDGCGFAFQLFIKTIP